MHDMPITRCSCRCFLLPSFSWSVKVCAINLIKVGYRTVLQELIFLKGNEESEKLKLDFRVDTELFRIIASM